MQQGGFNSINRQDSICICEKHDDIVIFSIMKKPWDSDFFNKKIGILQIENIDFLNRLTENQVADALDRLLLSADRDNYDLTELHIDISNMRIIPIIEDAGFRLVDSRITFITLINREEYEYEPLPVGTIAYATTDDLDAITRLTDETLVINSKFFSRFKNERYYAAEETRRYYKAWISNHIEDPNAFFVVMKDNGRLFAYFIYKKNGFFHEKPVYKGILTAVDPDYRGKSLHIHMQAYLYKQFPEKEFFIDNTTQLSNIPTIKSHIKSQKQLAKIQLTFYRKRHSELTAP